MRRAGGTVALVLLIDAFTWTGATRVTALRLFSSIWRGFSAESAKGYSFVRKLFAALKESSQLFWWLTLQMPGVLKPRMSTKMSHPTSLVDSEGMPLDEFALRKLNRLVGRAYCPELLDTRGVLLRAHLPHEAVLPEVDVTNGWRDLFSHGVEVVQVVGDHLSIIRNDQDAAELADKITAVLNHLDLPNRDERK
jgi:thioesterase domain-containing protein